MLKRSPLSAKPIIAARKTSMSAWKSTPTSSKYRHEKTRLAVASSAASVAIAADARSTSKSIPSATPCAGRQPPNQ